MKIIKSLFYLSNFTLILFYLYPGNIFGCFLYDDCQIQPQLTRDLSIFSSNHLYSFIIVSLLGFISFKNRSLIFFLKVIILKFLKIESSSRLKVTYLSLVTDLPNIEEINSVFLKNNSTKGTITIYKRRYPLETRFENLKKVTNMINDVVQVKNIEKYSS